MTYNYSGTIWTLAFPILLHLRWIFLLLVSHPIRMLVWFHAFSQYNVCSGFSVLRTF